MTSTTQTSIGWKSQLVPLVLAILCALGLLSYATLESKQTPSARGFATPNEAAQTLVQATQSEDLTAVTEILGPEAEDLISSADHVSNRNRIAEFAALAREKNSVSVDPDDPKTATLSVGNDEWPFPIPIVKKSEKWYYDAKSGREEILFRRIGENELDAIKICKGFVEAQKEYALDKHDGSEVNQYAQRIVSTPGKQDGLAWQNTDGTWSGPVGETIANALAQGYDAKAQPFHGYFFKVLKGQGPLAPLGEMDFVVEGIMIGGFALAAAPAQYEVTGVQTFIVSHDGVIYQKDLGPHTLTILKNLNRYNPDKTWHPVSDGE